MPDIVMSRIHARYPGYTVRPRVLLLSANSSTDPPRVGMVFVLDHDDDQSLVTCDDRFAEHEASLFLRQVAPTVFDSYSKVFAASVGRRLREALEATNRTPSRWSAIAQTIRQEMLVDAVLIYQREGGSFKVTGTSEGHHGLIGLRLARPSLTERCIEMRRHKLVPDTSDWLHPDAPTLHRRTLAGITEGLGWKGVRSWYCQPVIAEDRSLGAIKLLTRDGGMFLDQGCVEVVTAIAARIATEMTRHFTTEVLRNLNQLAENLSGKEGTELAGAMLRELEQWAHEFVHEDCLVVIMASLQSPQATVFAASEQIDAEVFEQDNEKQLTALGGPTADLLMNRANPFTLPAGIDRAYQIPALIQLSSNSSLRGCLLLITKQAVGQRRSVAREAAFEAAREIAVLLDYELRARLRLEQAVRFRHALLGPVQGLMNQAGHLTRLIKRGEVPFEDARRIAAYMKSEANAIGLWRDLQRLYETKQVRVVPRMCALRPIVERCVDRFKEPIRFERDSELQLEFPPGSITIPIDESAIDLALNNLLDNARKYCFFHTEIFVTVESSRSLIRIVVEDTGHGIPERLKERIYQVGERLDWEDHVRSITGTGLGLPISRAVVEAHGGHLYHECDPPMTTSETKRTRVRFIIELPSGWR